MAQEIVLKKIKIKDATTNTIKEYDVKVKRDVVDLETDVFANDNEGNDDVNSLKIATSTSISDIFNK